MKPIKELLQPRIDEDRPFLKRSATPDEMRYQIAVRKAMVNKLLPKGPWPALYSKKRVSIVSQLKGEIDRLEVELDRQTVLEPYHQPRVEGEKHRKAWMNGRKGNQKDREEMEQAIEYYEAHKGGSVAAIARDFIDKGTVLLKFDAVYRGLLRYKKNQ